MLHVSLPTVISAVITTNIFIILLTICLSHNKLLLDVGYRLLAFFVLFTVLRLAFPFELPFTITFRLPKFFSSIIFLFNLRLGTIGGLRVSLRMLLFVIWVVGVIFVLIRYIFSYCKTRYQIILYGKELTHKAPYAESLEHICRERERKNRFRVIELPGLSGPALFGALSPKILIPEKFDLSEQDIYCILRHETTHHFHHDLLLKIMVKLITLVYWWNPFCRRLNKQTSIILEMRVDDSLTLTDTQLTMDYMQCLISAKNFAAKSIFISNEFTMELLPQEPSDILKRFSLLQYNQSMSRPAINTLLVLLTLSMYLLSYLFIGEPFNSPKDSLLPPIEVQDEQKEVLSLSPEDCYFIDNGNGTYDLYYYDEYFDTIDNLEYYNSNIPIYLEEHRSQ